MVLFVLGTFLVHLPKEKTGQHFDNLGMLTTLLANSKKVEIKSAGSQPLIEVIGEHGGSLSDNSGTEEDVFTVEEKEFDWSEEESCATNGNVEVCP